MSQSTEHSSSTISGIDVMRGVGAKPSKPFWADAWDRVLHRWGARLGIAWIALIAFFAIFAPFVASGLPLWTVHYELLPDGSRGPELAAWSPLWQGLSAIDVALFVGCILGVPWVALPNRVLGGLARSHRIGILIAAAIQMTLTILIADAIGHWLASPEATGSSASLAEMLPEEPIWVVSTAIALLIGAAMLWLPTFSSVGGRIVLMLLVAALSTVVASERFDPPLSNYDRYIDRGLTGEYENIWTIVPWSSSQARTTFYLLPPLTTVSEELPEAKGTSFGDRSFIMGTDSVGQDVLSQMLHACRLSISIGLVSTGISVFIGIVVGSLMGYFGGWVDLVLSRVVEIFMAIPVLFLLIVAAAVLPRNTYMMMVIIGCVSWTLSARFIRAEFLKMRAQDFVQAAKAAGLPLRSVLFKHMLPNGITPVLVQASFAIAAAILAEATLSFLGLGPDGQASWGKLLASATGSTGTFNWWLAIFPGFAIFLTVLAYNLLGEAFRDAIDPKLRKAAH